MKYYIRKNWKINFAAAILIILAAVLQVLASVFLMSMVDTMVTGDIHALVLAMARLIGLWIVIMFVIYTRNVVRAKALEKMHNQIREDLTEGIARLSPQQFRNQKTGAYLSWFNNDIQQLDNCSFQVFFQLISNITVVVAALGTLIYLNVILAAICMAGALLLLFLPKLVEKKANAQGKALSAMQEEYVKQLKSHLDGFYILKIFDRISYFKQEMEDASRTVEHKKYEYAKFSGKVESVFDFLSVVFQMGIFFVTALFVILGWVQFGAIVSIGNLAGFLCTSTEAIANASVSFAMGAPIWKKFEEVRNAAGQVEGAKTLAFTKEIALRDVGFSYEEKPILQHINVAFQKSGKYALVGPSGCGKTTILKLLMRYLDEYTGSILIDGEEIKNYTLSSLYGQISYIDQEVYLFDTTIRKNMTLDEKFSEEELEKAIRESALEEDLKKMPDGLETLVGENGNKLSGGQKQRIAIARALLHGQNILLMDEGTSALDQKNAFAVESKLLSNPDVTVILVSHHLDERLIEKFDNIYYPDKNEPCQV